MIKSLNNKNEKSRRTRKAAVRNHKAINDAITLEALECRQLMTVLSVTSYGASTNGSTNDQAAVQAALNAAKPGDTVSFPSGSYTIDGTLDVPTGVTVTGQSDGSSHIKFNLSGQNLYGFTIDGNDSNVTIENLDIVSTNGILKMADGSLYTNIHITNNRLEYGGGTLADGSLVYGLSGTIGNTGTQVTHNYFHDSPNSVRNWCFFGSSYSNFDYNTFYNINDGGQLEYMGADVSFSYNYGTDIHRMGQETAGSASTVNFKVDGNVFYDYVDPYNDTEGVSICIYGSNTQIENNYFAATIAPGSSWGQQSGLAAGGPNRFGYAIESSGTPGTVSGNTLVGTWAEDVSVMGQENVTGNKIYGGGLWGDVRTEPGPAGVSISINQSNNTEDANASDAPAPPANTNSYLGVAGSSTTTTTTTGTSTGTSTGTTSTGTTPTGTTTTGTTSTGTTSTGTTSTGTSASTSTVWNDTTATYSGTANGITGLVAAVLSDNSVKLSWTASSTLSSASVSIVTTAGGQSFPTLVYQGNVNGATILQLHAGWQYDLTVTGTTSTGATVTSQVATIRTTGNSAASYTLSPTAGASTLSTTSTSTSTGTTSTGTTSTGTTTTGTTGTTTTGTTSTATIAGATATVLSDNSVQLSWTNPNVTLTSASIEIVTTVGRQVFPAVVVNGNVSTAIINQLHPGWEYDFTIVGTTSTGATLSSNVITVSTTGNSEVPYTLAPVDQPIPPANPSVTGLTATVLSDTSVQLAWTNTGTLTAAMVNVITTVGRQSYAGVTVTGDADGVIITGLHAGWEFDFSISGTASDGSTVTSDVVTVSTTGSSTATGAVLGTINFNSPLLAA